jgi:hypothetical protein
MPGLTFQDWTAIGQAAFTALGLGGVIWTVERATRISNREKSFDAYIYFSAKFDEISNRRRELRERFRNGDKTLSVYPVRSYFKDYQTLVYREWELYRGGVIAKEVFISWAKGTHRYLHRADPISYFDTSGVEQSISPMDGFSDILSRSKVADPDFLDYIGNLLAIPVPDDEASDRVWRRKVIALVGRIRHTRAWTLK